MNLAANIALNLTDELYKSKYFSLALDSSTDITAISQLLLFVKYVSKDCVLKEDFLGMIPMTGQTRGIEYLNTTVNFFNEHSIDLIKVFSVCTDNCPSMLGQNIGFVQLLKKHLGNDNLLSFHCIIHQKSLAAKFGENFSCVMKTLVKIVNVIRSNELNYKEFQEFLKELSQYGDIIYHTVVRWLNKGKVLERFFSIRHEITLFLATKSKEFLDIYNFSWRLKVAFLTDTMSTMNETLTKWQGDYNNIVTKMLSSAFSLEQKQNIMYIEEFSNEDYSSFPSVKALFDEQSDENQKIYDLLKLLADLKDEMSVRFSDFRKFQEPFRLVENPWAITTANVAHLSIFGYEARDLKKN
ncbi:general transcription factor II-I repeat domain-containing protein 2A-like [Diabrotica virgifera virgifera]|uniref:General transcription factor II-I repeat domain-containing protein 2A-like n=1 Tax=Diabrotica virgifera virgifera TaxID=50390 RepID=A0A6P7F406_DIAVI|nr:general transcription factor II-I repeat domain-containing protein 2A-like [Diabrotica virgifera virgifera]